MRGRLTLGAGPRSVSAKRPLQLQQNKPALTVMPSSSATLPLRVKLFRARGGGGAGGAATAGGAGGEGGGERARGGGEGASSPANCTTITLPSSFDAHVSDAGADAVPSAGKPLTTTDASNLADSAPVAPDGCSRTHAVDRSALHSAGLMGTATATAQGAVALQSATSFL